MASDPSAIAAAIAGVTDDPHVEDGMLVGSYLESGFDPTAVGDGSFGAFQFQDGAAPEEGTMADYDDPAWEAAAIEPSYAAAAASVPDALWQSDPEMASEETAYGAERPAETYYASQGQAKVDQAWAAAQAAEGVAATAGTAAAGTATLTSSTSSSTSSSDDTGDVPAAGTLLGAMQAHLQPTVGFLDISGDLTMVITRWVGISAGGFLIVAGIILLFDDTYRALKHKGTAQVKQTGTDHMKRAAARRKKGGEHRKTGAKAPASKPSVARNLVRSAPKAPAAASGAGATAATAAKSSAVSEIAEAGGVLA